MMLNSNARRIFIGILLKKCLILPALCIFILNGMPQALWAQGPAQNGETATYPLIQFYQEHISGIDGDRCPMYPHCSQYCARAIQKHGFILGWIMSCDRLLRCGRDELVLSPHVRVNGHELTFDPVSANDFWWFSPQPSAIENNGSLSKIYHSGSDPISDLDPDQQK